MKYKKIILLYFTVLLIQLLGDYVYHDTGIAIGIWLSKPLLMPILGFWFFRTIKDRTKFHYLIIAALFFSWWGDIFLMPELIPSSFNFILGLASFLIAHLIYIRAFMLAPLRQTNILTQRPWLVFPFFLFLFAMISFLFNQGHPAFAEMSTLVIVYASIIMIMVLTALNRYKNVNHQSFKWVFIGAVCFMVSDSFIAFDRFSSLFNMYPYIARLAIMPLYVLGQFLIVYGCIAQGNKVLVKED